jgi:hypothetical protein
VLPDLDEVDDALRHSSRISDNLARIREAVYAHQHALAEHKARVVKGDYYEDDYSGLADDFKASGGFAGGDAKKRRGVSVEVRGQGACVLTDWLIESRAAWALSQL